MTEPSGGAPRPAARRAWVAFALSLAAAAGAIVGLRVALDHMPAPPTGTPATGTRPTGGPATGGARGEPGAPGAGGARQRRAPEQNPAGGTRL